MSSDSIPPTRPRMRSIKRTESPADLQTPTLAFEPPHHSVVESSPAIQDPNVIPVAPPSDILTRPFILCLVVGAILALFGHVRGLEMVGLIGPIATTAAYPLWGWIRGVNQRASLRERFADNAYYLGFIFTQISLLVGFGVPALLGQALTSADVLRYFGIAIGASMVGLVARTLLVQTGHSISENADIVEDEVEQLAREVENLARGVAGRARKMLTELDAVASEIQDTRKSLKSNLESTVTDATTAFEAHSALLRSQLAASAGLTTEVTTGLELALRHLAVTLRNADASLTKDVGVLGEHLVSATGAIEMVGSSFGRGADAISALQNVFSEKIATTGDTTRLATAALSRGVEALERFAGMGPELKAVEVRLAGLGRRVDDLVDGFQDARMATDAAGQAAVASVQASSDQVEARSKALVTGLSDSLEASVKALEAVLESFRAELERVRG